jgi:hypothetical protein
MTRRRLFETVLGVGALGAVARFVGAGDKVGTAPTKPFEVAMTEADWQKRLTPAQFTVLRKHGTERAGSSHLDKEYGPGIYHCAGCELALFSSDTKFDSGTGWPSFTKPLESGFACVCASMEWEDACRRLPRPMRAAAKVVSMRCRRLRERPLTGFQRLSPAFASEILARRTTSMDASIS